MTVPGAKLLPVHTVCLASTKSVSKGHKYVTFNSGPPTNPAAVLRDQGNYEEAESDVFTLRLLWASLNAFPCSQWTSPAPILGIGPWVHRSFFAVIR
jgi:hypothetical protein